ncbi:50S ribosomal protein L22 [Candidatus Saganbacteria bacterium]|nr:50S ribosomal protein L22 [Candidatus Saganbacteria bacterium]
MKVKAKVKYVRGSALKFRRIIKLLRGKPVAYVLAELKFMPHKSARTIYKVVKSAAANAVNNYKLNEKDLIVSEIFADSAGMIKRMRPRARGRGFPIKKRISHVTVYVATKEAK